VAPSGYRPVGFFAKFGKNGRLITGAGTDFKYFVAGFQTQRLRHQRHHKGLADGLISPIGNGASQCDHWRTSSGMKAARGTRANAARTRMSVISGH
jgi:hypothetical protein